MAMQTRLLAANPWLEWLDADMRPDGDAELDETRLAQLQVPACLHCGGVLMPDVVFFGGTIPPERVAQCLTALQQADALLVVGSSLKVYSGYRFCLRAREWGKPLALVNPGWTRADELASLKVMAPCAGVLETLLSRLAAATVPG